MLLPLCRLIVLALKHFEGTLETEELISSYLLCKSRWSIRKHVREMSTPKVSPDNVIKVTSSWQSCRLIIQRKCEGVPPCLQTFLMKGAVPPLPLACSTVEAGEQRPPVDRVTDDSPRWLRVSLRRIDK